MLDVDAMLRCSVRERWARRSFEAMVAKLKGNWPDCEIGETEVVTGS